MMGGFNDVLYELFDLGAGCLRDSYEVAGVESAGKWIQLLQLNLYGVH